MVRAWGLFIFLFFCSFSKAEYRVFVLEISSTGADGSSDSQLIKSTLDPFQYSNVFPLKNGESIRYVDTWRCYGRHNNFEPLCEKPSREPAAVAPTAELKTSSP